MHGGDVCKSGQSSADWLIDDFTESPSFQLFYPILQRKQEWDISLHPKKTKSKFKFFSLNHFIEKKNMP